MPKAKDDQMANLNNTLEDIAESLQDICAEISELRSDLQLVGTMITIDVIARDRPELKEKIAPLLNELIKGIELTIAEMDPETDE